MSRSIDDRLADMEARLAEAANVGLMEARIAALEARLMAVERRQATSPVVDRDFSLRPGNRALGKQLKDLH